MPSHLHEGLTDLFRSRPALTVELLSSALGVALPEHETVRAEPADLTDFTDRTDRKPTAYRADAVVVLSRTEQPVMAVVVEVQLRRDRRKRWSWPVYVATLRARLRCPVELLVVCPHAGVAAWCAAPIPLGGSGSQIVPLVLGPDLVPVVTAANDVRHIPELAVLSAIAHGGGAERRTVLPAFLHSLEDVETEHRQRYFELVYTALPAAARLYLEGIVSTETGAEMSLFERVFTAIGEGRAILKILDIRGIAVPDARRRLIAECRDLDQLDEWAARTATATSVEDLFD